MRLLAQAGALVASRCLGRCPVSAASYTPGVIIAAFVISVLALLVAAASGIYARHSALSAREVAEIEVARHRKEREPRFEVEIESVNEGGWHRLWLRLTSDEPLDGIEVTLDAQDGITFTSSQAGVDPNDRSHLHAKVPKRLDHRERAAWRVSLPEQRPRQATLLVSARLGHDSWNVPVHVDVPGDVANSVW